MSQDILIGFFFTGKDLNLIASRQKDFLLKAMGQTSIYTGKAPSQAHTALPPILKGHFDRRLVILQEVLKSEGVPDTDIKTWIDFEKAFRKGVVSGETK